MKRRFLSAVIVILVIVAIPLTVYAATSRMLAINPILQFNGATATCAVNIYADPTDAIVAEINLCKGSATIKTWNKSGTGSIVFKDYATVSTKGEYVMTVDISINGVKQPQVSDTNTYK